MGSDNRVLILHWLSSDNAFSVTTELSLLKSRMDRLQSMQSLLQWLRQTVVRLNLVAEKGVSSNLWLVKDIQERNAGSLLLIGDIGVPRNGAVAISEEGVKFRASLSVAMHDVKLREAFGRARCGVDVVTAEVTAEIEGFLKGEIGEILVTESDDFALGNEECEPVFFSDVIKK